MANHKYLSDILKVCSVLPALAVMPAVADLPNTTGNAWIFGDLSLGYDTANNSAIGGRVSWANGARGNDFPEYNVVGRSVNVKGTAGERPSLYVGPVNLTLRELGENEEFVYNWQDAGTPGESNWADAELQEGEVSYKDFDIAKQAGLVWNDSVETIIEKTGFDVSQSPNYLNMATGLSLFANRDDSVQAGNFSADNVVLTLDGTNVIANNILMNSSNLKIANANVPTNILNGLHNASDGYTAIKAENFVVQNGSRIDVENGATLDLSQSDDMVFSSDDVNRKVTLYNNGTVKFGGDVLFKNAVLQNNYSLTNDQNKIVYNGDDDITFVNTKISNQGIEYDTSKKAVVGGLVEFRTTGDISFSGDRVDTGSGAFVNSTILSDVILQADKISVSGGRADQYSGAIFNAGNMSFLAQENLFTDNHQTSVAEKDGYYKLGGGALYNRGNEYTAQMTIGFADGSSKNTFASNTALQNGGALEARTDDPNSSAVVDIIGTTLFSKNEAGVNGGAIMNWTDSDATSSTTVNLVGNAAFAENIAGANGGAIFNGGLNATVDMSKAIASFSGNKATVDGGAIYNDINAVLKIGDANFMNNHASYGSWESEGYGGAIFAKGDLDIVSEKENGVVFKDNVAFSGGAVYGSMKSSIGMNIENALFEENHAIADAGALGIFNDAVSNVTDTTFRKNTVAVAVDGQIAKDDINRADGGGAIQLGGTASADLVNTRFVGNVSGVRGGAISARHGKNYELNISDSAFTANQAGTNGGAIAHIFAGTMSAENTDFVGNKANESGGAIYNGKDWNFGGNTEATLSSGNGVVNISGENLFSGNNAGLKGGAIFNGADAVINMSGVNIFENNMAHGALNDIYNDGVLNIAEKASVSLTGGVNGAGTFNLADGATLNINSATILQESINIGDDTTIIASILSKGTSNRPTYGRFKVTEGGSINVGEGTNLVLNVGTVGTYDIFGTNQKQDLLIDAGKTYIATEQDNGTIVVETKSVEDIVSDTGLTEQGAMAVANLSNSVDRSVQKISLRAQEALNQGDVKLVEKELAKLAPEDKPVVRAVAMSAQSQALSLASGRMAVGAGRAGGDKLQTNGFWAQGLFNKTKYADQFHGYSRGFAIGADTTIDRKYTIGAGLTYSNSDVHSGGKDTSIDTTTLFVYGQYKPAKWFLNGTLAYAMSEYDENIDPFGEYVNSVYDVSSLGLQAMTGYAFNSGLMPQVGLRYQHIAQDEYNNGINRINATDFEYLSGVAGLKYAFNINTKSALKIKPELHAMMTYDLVQDNSAMTVFMNNTGGSYIVQGENLSRVGGEFGIGLNATYNSVDVALTYDIVLHEDYTSQTGMIKLRSRF